MIELIRAHVLPAAYAVLPPEMSSPEATRMLLAIGWQESRFEHRFQLGGGPARGFWQFESGGGVRGVLNHASTRKVVRDALTCLRYPFQPTPAGCHFAIEHNDIAAAVFARLLLWVHPDPLPTTDSVGWAQYIAQWRPGKPHPETWAESWRKAEALT